MSFTAYHVVNLIIFFVAIVFAQKTVLKLQKKSATYDSSLLPFAYLSLTFWIVGALQYLTLVVGSPTSIPSGFFVVTGLWLGVTQNVLWAGAILSLHSEQVRQIYDNLSFLKTLPIVIAFALLTYRTELFTSEKFFSIDAVFAAVIFTSFALLILQWRLAKLSAAVFSIHGYSYWVWKYLWLTPLADTPLIIVAGFPLWRIAILIAWIKLISALLRQAPPSATPSRRRITFIHNHVVWIVVSVLLTIALRRWIETTWPYLADLWNEGWRRTVGTIVIGLLGLSLFLLRKDHQKLYGKLEVVFAVMVCWFNIGKAQDAVSWIAVVAAAYLIVRGLTNYEEGRKKDSLSSSLVSDNTGP